MNPPFTLPFIDKSWEATTNLPQWFGWVLNHLALRLRILQVPTEPNYADEVLSQLKDSIAAFPSPARKVQMWDAILNKALLQTIQPYKEREVISIVETAAKLRRTSDEGGRVTSQEWKDIEQRILEAYQDLHDGLDKTTPQEERNRRIVLGYALNAAKSAVEKNSKTTVANALRDTINAMECAHEPKTHPHPLVAMSTILTTAFK